MSVLNFKPFFVHFNRPVLKTDGGSWMHRPRGFTAFLEPHEKDRLVLMRAVMCSAQEKEFKKAQGRQEVMDKDPVEMNARDVGAVLEGLANKCCPEAAEKGAYNYIYKYMV